MFSLSVKNTRGDKLELSNNANYQITKVEGLNPPPANVNLTELSGMDGSKKNFSKVPSRNLVLYIKMLPSVEENRLNLYNYFKVGQDCTIYFANGSRNVFIEGIVETIECPLFDINQTMQISIICPQPYFSAVDYFIAEISNIVAMFEFPFSIEEGGEEFSAYDKNRISTVFNRGDVEIGFLIKIYANNTVINPCIWNSNTREYFRVNVTLNQYDLLEICTIRGERSVRLKREGKGDYENIINLKGEGSSWLTLAPGCNTFTYTTATGDENAQIEFIAYDLYQGV